MRAMKIADDLNNGTGVAVAKVVTTLGSLPVTGALALAAALSLAVRRRVAEARRARGRDGADGLGGALGQGRGRPPAARCTRSSARWTSPIRPGTRPTRSSTSWWRSRSGGCSRAGRAASGVVGAAVALAVLIGLTRIYLRAHYFSDVIGGYGLARGLFSL